MTTIDEIKSRAEAVEDDTKVITLEEAYEIAVQSQDDVPKLLAALEAVLELHFRMPGGSCAGCFTNYGEREEHWPCDTVSSITEALA